MLRHERNRDSFLHLATAATTNRGKLTRCTRRRTRARAPRRGGLRCALPVWGPMWSGQRPPCGTAGKESRPRSWLLLRPAKEASRKRNTTGPRDSLRRMEGSRIRRQLKTSCRGKVSATRERDTFMSFWNGFLLTALSLRFARYLESPSMNPPTYTCRRRENRAAGSAMRVQRDASLSGSSYEPRVFP